jgi:hypothetical protein
MTYEPIDTPYFQRAGALMIIFLVSTIKKKETTLKDHTYLSQSIDALEVLDDPRPRRFLHQ